jgi:uncharacterized membrane protein
LTRIALPIVALCLIGGSAGVESAAAVVYAKPGDTGTIVLPVRNYMQGDTSSLGPMENVEVEVTAPEEQLVTKEASLLGPVTSINPGDSYSFKVIYEIPSDAPEGELLVQLRVKTATPNTAAKPPDGSWDTSVTMKVDRRASGQADRA